MKSFGLTDKGSFRKDNQDSFIIEKCDQKNCLIIGLCDGMGGAKAGGLASQLSNKAFVDYVYGKLSSRVEQVYNYKNMLKNACEEANGVSYAYSKFDEAYNGMGTTIVGGVIKNGGKAYIINVGDSRAYHISRKNSSIYQVTRDHSLVGDLVAFGAITKEQARIHPQRNVITRALGSEEHVEADYFELTMRMGDCLLFCSDGLSNTLTDEEMLEFAMMSAEPETLCKYLMNEALARGARDNVTVVAVMK